MDPMTQEANNSSVEVEVFGQAHSLCSPDPDYILKIAEDVDLRTRTLADETHTVDSEQLGVLAAVRIAAEYDFLRRKLVGRVSDSSMSNTARSGTGGRKRCPKANRGKRLAWERR